MKKEEPWSDNYLGPSTKCKICTNSFSLRGDFMEHHMHLLSLRTKALQAPTVGRLWAALDRRLACDTCSFAASNEGEVTLHYGIEHGGLNFFRQEVLKRQSLGGMLVSGEDLLSTRVADGNCKAKWRSYDPQQELKMLSSPSVHNQCMPNGQPNCNICGLRLPSEYLTVAHLGLRPHFKADTLVWLQEAQSARMLACKPGDEIPSEKKGIRRSCFGNTNSTRNPCLL